MEFLISFNFQIIFQVILATFLGALIGLEREFKKKEAGLQTYSLVSLGSCLFTIICFELFNNFTGKGGINFDPSRVVQAVAVGIGFLGAGVIFQRPSKIEGLTTAAGLWTVSSIGIAVGVRLYLLASFSTLLVISILFGFGFLEKKYFKKR